MTPTKRHTSQHLLAALLIFTVYALLNLFFQEQRITRNTENEQIEWDNLENNRNTETILRKIDSSEEAKTDLSDRVDSTQPTAENFSRVFSHACPTDYLGLTDYGRELCTNLSAEMCQLLTCRNLLGLEGNENDLFYGHARLIMKEKPKKLIPDEDYHNLTVNCGQFKKLRGYRLKPVNRDEEAFPLAFNILAHKSAEQVERLLRSIYRPQNVYCIHVDTKASPVFRDALRSIASCFENVKLASRSVRIVYAGYSRLQADINCMHDNLDSKVRWKYLINAAAQAYPLRSVTELVRILGIYNGANDIEGMYGRSIIKQRFQREWEERGGQVEMTGFVNPRPPHDIDIVRGSAYGVFSRGFVRFILEDQRAIDLLNWSRKTFSPDEHYWATLHHTYSNPHLRTPGGFSGYPNNKTWLAVYANWDEQTCRGKLVHGVCVFGVGDLPALLERPELFANKFYQDFEPLALDCLEAWIRHKDDCPVPLDEDFYRKQAFVKKPLWSQ